jgi:hypothetical protein
LTNWAQKRQIQIHPMDASYFNTYMYFCFKINDTKYPVKLLLLLPHTLY